MIKRLLIIVFFAVTISTEAQIAFTNFPAGPAFENLHLGSFAFADVDGDMDEDVFITGINGSSQGIAKLYINDGTGVFTQNATLFRAGVSGKVAFADVDGDLDQDLIITGQLYPLNQNHTSLYLNDGNGNFTPNTVNSFFAPATSPSYPSNLAFVDIDGDNDQDLLIIGADGTLTPNAVLYSNNGSGVFTEVTGTTIEGVQHPNLTFSDIDADLDQDLLISGEINTSQKSTKLYQNDGNGVFTEVTGTSIATVSRGPVAFADIDGDNDNDLLITGLDNANNKISKLYNNDGNGVFAENTGTTIDGITNGGIDFADIDGDNALDLLITGSGSTYASSYTKLYNNNGTGTFTQVAGTPFQPELNSYCSFLDVNGDTKKDLLVMGGIVTTTFPWMQTAPLTQGWLNITCPPGKGTDTRTECDSLLWIDGNTYFTNNNTATFSIVNGSANGCDSIVTLNLTIINSSTGVDTQTVCDSLLWIDGNTYYSSNNTATFNITGGAANGCDSLVTLDLTIINSVTGIDTQTECDSLLWIDGNTYYFSNNTAIFNINGGASNGCDSIVTLDLTIINSVTGIDTQTACDSLLWIDGNTYYSNNNTATFNIFGGAANGCDSLVTLDLNMSYSSTGTDTRTECDSLVWIDGNTYFSSNNTATYNILGGALNSCDSLVSLDLTIINSATGTDTRTECISFLWIDGNTYYESNNSSLFNIEGGAANGCDSLVALDLTITPLNSAVTLEGETLTSNEIGASYQWLNCPAMTSINGATNQSYTATVNGEYSVIVTKNGCTEISNCYMISTLGFSEINFEDKIQVYPNPTNGNFAIDLGQNYENAIVTITDMQGRILQSNNYNESQLLNLKLNESAGVYVLIVEAGDKKSVIRLIKE